MKKKKQWIEPSFDEESFECIYFQYIIILEQVCT